MDIVPYILAHGNWISMEEFMELALYDEEGGYYSRNISNIGFRGDFSTSATMCDLLARRIVHQWRESCRVHKRRLPIIEIGGGNGDLAMAICRNMSLWERIFSRYLMVDRSRTLRNLQGMVGGHSVTVLSSVQKALKKTDSDGLLGKKSKEKRLAKLMAVTVCILTVLFLVLNLIVESGFFASLFGEKIRYRDYPPLGEEYFVTPNWEENIFDDGGYLEKDRSVHYTSNGVTLMLEDDDDFESAGQIALFFREYFDAVINGDHEKYNSLLTDLYKKEYGETKPFTMQKLYEIEVTNLNCISYLNEGTANTITVFEFDVAYKIMDNNGTFRNNLVSDDKRPVRFFLYRYASGEIRIFDIEEYRQIIK